ncbi:MAG: agmatinase [bacterium]|jgi:agmatinase|nr:agmatinase [bacterium]
MLLERLVAGASGDFLGLEAADCAWDKARVAVLGVPYDGTSTYQKGADHGPAALLAASSQVELYDLECHTEVHRLGICTLAPLPVERREDPCLLADRVEEAVGAILAAGRLPVLLGGEHSVSIGAIRAAQAAHGDLTVVQVDAHADTREEYHGSPCNHACVMARAREGGPIVQVGIRSLDAAEAAVIDAARVHPAHRIHRDATWLERIRPQLSARTWLTIDLDGLDSSQMPATGTPEPGGLSWVQVVDLVGLVCRHSQVVGFDVVELRPLPGNAAPDFLAARLVHRILGEIFREDPAARLPGPAPLA